MVTKSIEDNELVGWGIYCPAGKQVYWASPRRERAEDMLLSFGMECDGISEHEVVQIRW